MGIGARRSWLGPLSSHLPSPQMDTQGILDSPQPHTHANVALRPERLKEAVERPRADLIGLAELASTPADALRHLSELYPFQYLYGLGIPAKGLLSRWPLRDGELVELHSGHPDLRATAML